MIRKYVTTEILVLVVLLVVGDAFSFYEVSRSESTGSAYAESRRKTIACRDLIALIKDAETGQRGYLLTGDEDYLDPYYAALRGLDALTDELDRTGLALNPDVQKVRRLVKEKLEELDRTISLRRLKGPEEALAVVRTNRGKVLMDEIRQVVGGVQKENDAAANESRQSLASSLRVVKYLRGVQTVLAVVLGAMLVRSYAQARRDG